LRRRVVHAARRGGEDLGEKVLVVMEPGIIKSDAVVSEILIEYVRAEAIQEGCAVA
jgi:hypothetical protein